MSIALIKPFIAPKNELIPEIEKTLYSGYIAQGAKVDEFEVLLGKKFQVNPKNILTVNSGTAALHIALILAGVKRGDEVISTAWTAEPTNVAIKMSGGNIIYGDIDAKNGNLCPISVESKITKKTKAIVIVDYSGISVDVKKFKQIEKKYNIPIIHDVAHSLGTTFKDLPVGNHFEFTAFSFQAIKHLTTVDGGCLVVKDSNKAQDGRKIRWFGLDKSISRMENSIKLQGYKYHMNDINATIGITQFKYYDEVVTKHKHNAKILRSELSNLQWVEHPKLYSDTDSSFWFLTLFCDKNIELINYLNKNNIVSSQLHKRNDMHPLLKPIKKYELVNLNEYLKKMLHIPCGWWLNENDIDHIIKTIRRFR